MHTRPQATDIVCGLSRDNLWERLRRSNGAGIDELGGRLLWVEEGRLDILRIEVHIIRLEVLASEVHKVVGWAQAREVAVVEGVLIDVAVVHVDGQSVGDGTLGEAGLLTVEIIVVTWTAECWLLRWQGGRCVGDGSGRELLLLSAGRDGGRVVGDLLVLGEVNQGVQRIQTIRVVVGGRHG